MSIKRTRDEEETTLNSEKARISLNDEIKISSHTSNKSNTKFMKDKCVGLLFNPRYAPLLKSMSKKGKTKREKLWDLESITNLPHKFNEILNWSCQGIRLYLTIPYLKDLVRKYNSSVIFLMQTENQKDICKRMRKSVWMHHRVYVDRWVSRVVSHYSGQMR